LRRGVVALLALGLHLVQSMDETVTAKQREFNAAMVRYERDPLFRLIGSVVSVVNVALQLIMVGLLWERPIPLLQHLLAFALAYVLADFVNGWVHLYMDSSDNYASPTGPFFAAFHLHHRTPKYRRRPLLVVYYEESGSKVWLAFVEVAAALAIGFGIVNGIVAYALFYFAVLSCVAEVSHYLCHTPQNKLVRLLGRMRVLLSSRYHAQHHREDNVQYAFLNGMSDPVLNFIARRFYPGYKSTTDHHYADYSGRETANRANFSSPLTVLCGFERGPYGGARQYQDGEDPEQRAERRVRQVERSNNHHEGAVLPGAQRSTR